MCMYLGKSLHQNWFRNSKSIESKLHFNKLIQSVSWYTQIQIPISLPLSLSFFLWLCKWYFNITCKVFYMQISTPAKMNGFHRIGAEREYMWKCVNLIWKTISICIKDCLSQPIYMCVCSAIQLICSIETKILCFLHCYWYNTIYRNRWIYRRTGIRDLGKHWLYCW